MGKQNANGIYMAGSQLTSVLLVIFEFMKVLEEKALSRKKLHFAF